MYFFQNLFPLIASPIVQIMYYNSLNRKLEKILRSEKNCRSGVHGLIKSFWFHIPRSLDSKNACLWFLNKCCYILLFVFKKTKTKCDDKQYT